MTLTRYREYKDSGVVGLGDVPRHWEIIRLGTISTALQTGPFGSQLHAEDYVEDQTPVVNPSQIQDGRLAPDWSCTVPLEIVERLKQHVLESGDIVFGRRGEMGRCAMVSEKEAGWLCGTGSLNIRLGQRASPEFVSIYLRTIYVRELLTILSVGSTMDNLNASILSRVPVPIPPLPEQTAIATFLDGETGKIDALVAEQEKLIALLKEKRQAVISHAVTKGLDPAAAMKDSGIEWLGEVPAHWACTKIGHFIQVLSGFAFPSSGFSHDERDVKLLRGVNVGVNEIRWDDTVYWQRTDDDGLREFELSVGDIVLGMDRPWISKGVRIARLSAQDMPCLLLQRVALIRTTPHLTPDFAFSLLNSTAFVSFLEPDMTGVSVPHISPGQISSFPVAIPSVDEQEAIVSFLLETTPKIDTLVAEAQRAIALLKERRTALISAAVTGKIDVRGLVDMQEAA